MKRNILVLMGGKSEEFDVSMASGREIIKNLNSKKYNVFPVVISKDGRSWLSVASNILLSVNTEIKEKPQGRFLLTLPKSQEINIQKLKDTQHIDICFIALHGKYGEDGSVQGMLNLAGIKYTGSGVLASALGMNKLVFRRLMKNKNIDIPEYVSFKKGQNVNKIYKKLGDLPYFVKPNQQGSSIGASLVKSKKDLAKAINFALKYDDIVLIDKYIKGTEISVPVMGNKNPQALPLIEILPKKGNFFNYESKYTKSGSEEIVPARISNKTTLEVKSLAVSVFKAVGCRGFARVDIILDSSETPYVLEINTIPGMTPNSLFPKSAKALGISYPELLDKIINYAIQS